MQSNWQVTPKSCTVAVTAREKKQRDSGRLSLCGPIMTSDEIVLTFLFNVVIFEVGPVIVDGTIVWL
jgi:hypothetical protein